MVTSPENNVEESEGIDILHYFFLFWRNKFLIIAIGILCALPAAFYVSGLQHIYESTVSLMLDQNQKSDVSPVESLYGIDTRSSTYINTQYELLRSRNLAEQVIDRLNLMENPDFVGQPSDANNESEPWYSVSSILKLVGLKDDEVVEQSINQPPENDGSGENLVRRNRILTTFGSRLRVNPTRNTTIVRVSFMATNPQLAADIANDLAGAYIETNMEQRISSTQQASQWLSERVASLNSTLKGSEERLQDFLEREELVDVGGVNTLNVQELDELNRQSIEAQRNRIELENQYRQITDIDFPTTAEFMIFPFIHNHVSVQQVKSNVDLVEQELSELRVRYGRNHPRMITLSNEHERLNEALEEQINQLVNSIGSEYRAALINEESTQERLDRSKDQMQQLNRKSFELQELEREVETNRQLYEMFFTRVRETQETDDLMTTNAVIVDPAVPAAYPSGPQRRKTVMLAMALGLALGCALVFLRDMLSSTISDYSDIETKLKSTVLGLVPLARPDKKEAKKKNNNEEEDSETLSVKSYLAYLKDKTSPFSEAFRTIRTSITLSSLDQPHKIISVTSTLPGEGKTTTSINLAFAMGQMKNVLLIETDLRRPTFNTFIRLPKDGPGLSNYLAGNNSLSECIYNLNSSGITVMPAGRFVPNPLELLSSNKFKNMLESLCSKFDHIILDAPPSAAVSDSLVLGTLSSGVVYVIKANSTPTKNIKRQLFRLKGAGINVIGAILNQVDISKHADYGGYYDSHGYNAEAPQKN